MSLRIWQELPVRYRVSNDPEEPITLWRGDSLKYATTGMVSILSSNLAEQAVYNSLQHGAYPPLRTLVSRHVQGNESDSPFISLTNDIEIARKFSQSESEVVYKLSLPAFRLVADPLWAKAPAGEIPVEYLAIGRIELSDIIDVIQ